MDQQKRLAERQILVKPYKTLIKSHFQAFETLSNSIKPYKTLLNPIKPSKNPIKPPKSPYKTLRKLQVLTAPTAPTSLPFCHLRRPPRLQGQCVRKRAFPTEELEKICGEEKAPVSGRVFFFFFFFASVFFFYFLKKYT